MFGLVVLGLMAFFFIVVPEAMFIIFAGILVALILLGLVQMIKKKVSGNKNLLLISTISIIILSAIGVTWLISSRIAVEMTAFSQQLPEAMDEFMAYLKGFEWFGKLKLEASEGNWLETFIAPKVLPKTAKMATVILNGITAFGIALFLGVYFAVDSKRYGMILLKLVPHNQHEKYKELFRSLEDNLQNWLLGKLLSMLAVFALTYVGLLLLGIKAAFPLAFISGFLSFIPNVGPILSVVPAVFIAFAQGWRMILYVAVLYTVVQALEGMFITPLIQKHKVKILPAALISFQFIMAILYGFPGLFLATPVLVALMTVVQKFWIEEQIKRPNIQRPRFKALINSVPRPSTQPRH
ncbi:MAG: AI-2E family transporter [Bacteriovoracaceae bacterium]|nr:AI-2E family transporter [Bacteriovoracaceae bacterium]